MAPRNIYQLTYLRFFLALSIYIHHFLTIGDRSFLNSFPVYIQNFIKNSFGAVSIFFVLSGFVIMFSTLQSVNKFKVARFYGNRLVKIYPLYLCGLFLTIIFIDQSSSEKFFISHLVMFQTIIPTSNYSEFSFNLPAWSICAEMFFYLIFPFFAFFIKISNFKYIWFPLLIFTITCNFIYAKVWTTIMSGKLSGNSFIDSLSVVFISYAENYPQVSFDYVIYTNPYSRLFNFFAGVSIAIGFYYFPQFFKSFTLKLFLFVVIIKIFHIVVSDNTLSNSAFGRDFIFFLLAISLITLILSVSSNSLKNNLRLQEDFQFRKFLILLGNSSYALYILQWPFLHFATMLISGPNVVLNMIILLVSIVIMIGISIGAHLLIERPLVRRFK